MMALQLDPTKLAGGAPHRRTGRRGAGSPGRPLPTRPQPAAAATARRNMPGPLASGVSSAKLLSQTERLPKPHHHR